MPPSLSFIVVGLAGCGGNFRNVPDVTSAEIHAVPIGEIQGSSYGGQQPIWLSHVYLMKASTSGYGAASTSILTSGANTTADTSVLGTPANPAYYVTTNGFGNFDITGDYSCNYNATNPSQSDELYLVSLGGNATYVPGNPPTGGATNSYIGLMSVLGQCPSDGTFAGHLSFIYMNEISTVAAAYALAGFASNSHSVGSASAALAQTGMANAFANANQLYDIQGSSVLHEARQTTPAGNGTVPYKLLNTLGNIMAQCINQGATAQVPTSGACQTLYNDTNNAPDVASAMLYIAQHPNSNVTALFNLQGTLVQFPDNLATKPNDFTVGINYLGTSFANPIDVAVDGTGNAWVTSGNGYLLKLTPTGTQATGSPFTLPNANYVTIDTAGNAWVTADSLVYEVTNSGAPVTGSPYISGVLGGGLAQIATDGTSAYVTNPNAGLNLLGINTPGEAVKITPTGGGGATYSVYYTGLTGLFGGAALNNIPYVSRITNGGGGTMWLSGDSMSCLLGTGLSCGGLQVQQINETTDFPGTLILSTPIWTVSNWVTTSSAVSYTCTGFLGLGGCTPNENPEALAVDNAGTGWIAIAAGSGGSDKLAHVSASGAVSALLTGGGLSSPQGVAIDGAGNVFVANTGTESLTEYVPSTGFATGSTGYIGSSNGATPTSLLNTPTNLDVDESGDVWVVNAAGSSGYVTEFIGIATPTVRPLSYASANGKLGAQP